MRTLILIRSVIAVLIASILLAGPVIAQVPAPPQGITALGQGSATAPADRTTFQISFSTEMFGPPTAPQPGATPGAEERERLQPIVDALVSAGVDEAGIAVVVPPFLSNGFSGPYGPIAGYVEFSVDNPTAESNSQIMNAAVSGAAEAGLITGNIDVLHSIEDCASLQQEASELAFEDARRQAEQQAGVMGIALGDVTASRDASLYVPGVFVDPSADASNNSSCSYNPASLASYTSYGPKPADLAGEPEVIVVVATEITFAIEGGSTTPAP
jgi:uncharacterized protein YggE